MVEVAESSGGVVDLSEDLVDLVELSEVVSLVVPPPIPNSGRHGQRGQSVSDRDNNV